LGAGVAVGVLTELAQHPGAEEEGQGGLAEGDLKRPGAG
jgi:hypothetical protein